MVLIYKTLLGRQQLPKQSLLVYFGQQNGRTYGVQQGPQVTNTGTISQSAFAKQLVSANQPYTFITLLLPHTPDQSPANLANQIQVKSTDDQQTIITLSLPKGNAAGKLQITFNKNGTWKVDRSLN